MKLESRLNKKDWIDFGDPLRDKEIQFMMEHFGFPNTDHLSDEECKDLVMKLEGIEAWEHAKSTHGVDKDDSQNYDEMGDLKRRPLSEYALMIGGMILYIGHQFHEGGRRYKPRRK
jgi:hypothetical protein